MTYAAVGLAGALGAIFRYWLGITVTGWWNEPFPLATLLINFIGCIALGWFSERAARIPAFPEWLRVAIATGLIGSFTTFSTFSVETVSMLQKGEWGLAILYVMLSLWGGLLLAWLGMQAGAGRRKQRDGMEAAYER